MSATTNSTDLLDVSPVIPVVVIDDVEHAVPLAQALVRGGIAVIEVTLRTAAALPAIERIAAEVPEILLGAGTVTVPAHATQAASAGARFLVTPGSTRNLLQAAEETGLPVLPGAATASEALALAELGYSSLKFFPAEAAGGVGYLRSLAGPLPNLRFCPTGGVSATNAKDYLALPNVGCVGGSWLTPAATLAAGDWDAVAALATDAASLTG
ncbi:MULTISPECIES: bifunctional 4-hydroxy-2-oxoglutarate aldolase/2-dehydro-3-deoxy-phosphogluconate aldolase [Actinoalloteichus]|uniref:2-dehydro-3-deoxy-phosphogluconate aldolase n=1 Tax=Actinoalloteichus fjordicus TaxID=1612552 RepID=A0AAC9PRF1_9PSEU|nr:MULTISPECIES: bifunctional 4-hydroxy-2-oxoglutarate aldolase/2-dehydro-3-deoxy-phosphogluconate aldolase [Actinoalloteichus]APU13776.1 Entner-Doudoroff aldolase [Actinoalloteichus fjordicus]APU19721.1 Entner-Doudoroff aldolase [Actinoalloteichus sp. GBA129-24]